MGRTSLLVAQFLLLSGCGSRSPAPPIPPDYDPPAERAPVATGDVEVRTGPTKPATPIVVTGRQQPLEKVEASAEAGLLRFIADHPTSSQTAEARLRLGSIYIDRAEAAFDGGDPDGGPALARLAIEQFAAARADFPGYARRDAVLYLLGYAAGLAGDAEVARGAYQELTALPGSPLVADGWLRLGELAFDDGDLSVAIDAYDRARRDPRFAPVAIYKLGWSHWRRGDMIAAATGFAALLDLATTNPAAAVFVPEAQQYLALALIEADQDGDGAPDPGAVPRVLAYLGDGDAGDRRATAEAAADALVDEARYAEAITIYDRLLITVAVADDLTRLSGKLATARARQRP